MELNEKEIDAGFRLYLNDFDLFSERVIGRKLRPYQLDPGNAIVRAVRGQRGGAFSIFMSRQAGKNELSAQLEAFLLSMHVDKGGAIVKCAPAFRPQTTNSLLPLTERLNKPKRPGAALRTGPA